MPVIKAGRWLRHECPNPDDAYVRHGYGRSTPEDGDVYECETCDQRWVWRWRKHSSGSKYREWRPLRVWDREAAALRAMRQEQAAQRFTATPSTLTAQELADLPDHDD